MYVLTERFWKWVHKHIQSHQIINLWNVFGIFRGDDDRRCIITVQSEGIHAQELSDLFLQSCSENKFIFWSSWLLCLNDLCMCVNNTIFKLVRFLPSFAAMFLFTFSLNFHERCKKLLLKFSMFTKLACYC